MLICKYYVVVRAQGGACVRRDDMAVDQVQAYQLGRHGAVIPLPPIRRVVCSLPLGAKQARAASRPCMGLWEASNMGPIPCGHARTHAAAAQCRRACACMHMSLLAASSSSSTCICTGATARHEFRCGRPAGGRASTWSFICIYTYM